MQRGLGGYSLTIEQDGEIPTSEEISDQLINCFTLGNNFCSQEKSEKKNWKIQF